MRSRALRICCGIALLLAVAGTGVWLVDGNHDNHSGVSGGRFWARLKHVKSSKQLTSKWFRSFAIARSHPEILNPRVSSDIEKTLGVEPGTFRDPQYVHTRMGGMWLVWARGSACILDSRSGAVSCATLKSVIREGLPLGIAEKTEGGARSYELLGVAPDWAKAIRLKVGEEHRRTLIHRNAYSYRADSRILLERLERR